MALLGSLMDIVHASRAGDDLAGVTLMTFNHSLAPQLLAIGQTTGPDIAIPVMRSIAGLAAQANPALFWVGANLSINTIGVAVPSAASAPTIAFDVLTQLFHSYIK